MYEELLGGLELTVIALNLRLLSKLVDLKRDDVNVQLNLQKMCIKTHDSESRGQEEAQQRNH